MRASYMQACASLGILVAIACVQSAGAHDLASGDVLLTQDYGRDIAGYVTKDFSLALARTEAVEDKPATYRLDYKPADGGNTVTLTFDALPEVDTFSIARADATSLVCDRPMLVVAVRDYVIVEDPAFFYTWAFLELSGKGGTVFGADDFSTAMGGPGPIGVLTDKLHFDCSAHPVEVAIKPSK